MEQSIQRSCALCAHTTWMRNRCIAILPTVGLRYNGSASAAKDRRCIVVHRPTSHSVSRTAYNNASAVMSKTPDLKKKIDASRRPSFSNLPLCHAADAEPSNCEKTSITIHLQVKKFAPLRVSKN